MKRDEAQAIHSGYFSIDKNRRLVDPKEGGRGEEKGLSTNAADYDLILKDKERLLSLAEPVRFIFSHSALREGWDNPNVFVMGMLKHQGNTISRRQEVGRGLRLAVNQEGARQDHPAVVHGINVLTVVVSESYKDFVAGLQTEISDSLSARPRKADKDYFLGKEIMVGDEKITIDHPTAKQICRYLDDNGYVDGYDQITTEYRRARAEGHLAGLPLDLADLGEGLFKLIDSVYDPSLLPQPEDDRKPKTIPLNENFSRKEFQELWARINRKAVYKVDFASNELIDNSARYLDKELKVAPLTYIVRKGIQEDKLTDESLKAGQGFSLEESATKTDYTPAHSEVSYDLIGKLTEATKLTRRTVAAILSKVKPQTFANFNLNPEHFISETGRLINEQKATTIVEKLSYDPINDFYDRNIFTADRLTLSKAELAPTRHIRDYVPVDSDGERRFVRDLNAGAEVVVYAKLPHGFFIPTPVGDYHPDWAIVFDEAKVRHIYFVAETKGSLSSLELRQIEQMKIECARKFFDRLNEELTAKLDQHNVTYDVVDSYGKLMELVRPTDSTNATGPDKKAITYKKMKNVDAKTLQYFDTEFQREPRTALAFQLIANFIKTKPGLPFRTYCSWAVWATAPKISSHFMEMTEIDNFQTILEANGLSKSGLSGKKLDAGLIFKMLKRSGVTIDTVTALCAPPQADNNFFSWTFPRILELVEHLEKIDTKYNECEQQELKKHQEEKNTVDASLFSNDDADIWTQARKELEAVVYLN